MFNFHSINTAEVNAGSEAPSWDLGDLVVDIQAGEDLNALTWPSPYNTDFFKIYWSDQPFTAITDPGVKVISSSDLGSFIPGTDPSVFVSYDHTIPAAYALSVLYYRISAYNENGWTLSDQLDSSNFRLRIYQAIYNKTIEDLTLRFTPEIRRQYEDSVLWRSFVQSLCSELAQGRFMIKESVKQMNLQKAIDVFLNLWKNITGIQRINIPDADGILVPETAEQYRQRLIDNIFWDKISNLALKKTLLLKLGYAADVLDEGIDATKLRTPSGSASTSRQYSVTYGDVFIPGEHIAFLYYGPNGDSICISDVSLTLSFNNYTPGIPSTPYNLFGATSWMFAVPTGAPYYGAGTPDANTKLLLPFETSYADVSASAHPVYNLGDAARITTDPKVGAYSVILSGAGWLQVEDEGASGLSDFQFYGGDFTIDFWYKPDPTGMVIGTYRSLYWHDVSLPGPTNTNIEIYTVDNYFSGSDPNPWETLNVVFKAGGVNQLYIGAARTGNRGGAAPSPTTAWTHVALVRSGTLWSIYINGQLKSFTTSSYTLPAYNNCVRIGSQGGSSRFFKGQIDNYRISNTARWTSNFAVPGDYQAIQGTITHDVVSNPFGSLPMNIGDVLTFTGVGGNYSEGKLISKTPSALVFEVTLGGVPQHYDVVYDVTTGARSVLTSTPVRASEISDGASLPAKLLSNIYSVNLGVQTLGDEALNDIYDEISPLGALGNVLMKILQDVAVTFSDWDASFGNIPYNSLFFGGPTYTGIQFTTNAPGGGQTQWLVGESIYMDNQRDLNDGDVFYGNSEPDDIVFLTRKT